MGHVTEIEHDSFRSGNQFAYVLIKLVAVTRHQAPATSDPRESGRGIDLCDRANLQGAVRYQPLGDCHTVWAENGRKLAPLKCMMKNFLTTALMGAALIVPVTLTPTQVKAADQKYHDKAHNDDHEWNSHEDKAYRMWAKENHRKYVHFDKLKDEDRENYWNWRHDHSDAVLKINIR